MGTTRTSITSFPRGHEFPIAAFSVSGTQRQAYLHATGDTTPYGEIVPPLAAVSLGLAALQEQISLPDGSLHTGQDVEHFAAVPVDAPLTLSGRVAQRSERQGMVITVLEFEIATTDRAAIKARTTIMAPGSQP
jgi:hypothetical protein